MTENTVKFNFEGRYFNNDIASNEAKSLLLVFHGYGQLGTYFLRKFDVLKKKGVRVVALEGLSRYYLAGSSGRVGASWMTRENRLVDIENYISYINQVYNKELSMLNVGVPVSALGFSQGAATVSRWITQPGIEFDHLILWAGLFPPDLTMLESKQQLNGKRVSFVYGLDDPYLSDERFLEQQGISERLDVNPEVVTFKGGHEIDRQVLEQFEFG